MGALDEIKSSSTITCAKNLKLGVLGTFWPWAPTYSWRPFRPSLGPLSSSLGPARLRPLCQWHSDRVTHAKVVGYCVSPWIVDTFSIPIFQILNLILFPIPIFSYASSSTLYPCEPVSEWAEFQTSVASRLVSLFSILNPILFSIPIFLY